MSDQREPRPYQERLIDGFERSRLRKEVQKSKRSRLDSLKRRYATMLLGASLAVGGLGFPLKSLIDHDAGDQDQRSVASDTTTRTEDTSAAGSLTQDLKAANEIARQVTGGVTKAAETITKPLALTAPIQQNIADIGQAKEAMRQEFFAKEVPFGQIIYREAKNNNLPPELVAAVVRQESKFVPTARSHRGAQGLMQLVPKTGRWMGASNLMNPAENVKAGAKYLRYLHDRFGGDSKKVIAAYNAGEGNVRRFGGVPPFRETRNYVSNVMNFKRELDDQLSGKVAEVLDQQGGAVNVAAQAAAVTR